MSADYRKFDTFAFVKRDLYAKLKGDLENSALTPQKRALIIEGDRGVGKTYLLLRLFSEFYKTKGYKVFFIGLDKYAAPQLSDAPNLWLSPDKKFQVSDMDELLSKMAKYLEIEFIKTLDVENKREYFAQQLAKKESTDQLILLIDGIYECDEKVRQQIEQDIIRPVLSWKNVIIILTGRGKRPVWIAPELRNAQIETLHTEGKEFVKQQLEQIKSTHKGEYETIYDWSGGCPLVVYLLGTAASLERDALSKSIDVLIRESLPENMDLNYDEVRKDIEKLALFTETFRDIETAFYIYPDEENNRSKARTLIGVLLMGALLEWQTTGYRLNTTVTFTVRKWLELEGEKETIKMYQNVWNGAVDQLHEKFPTVNREMLRSMIQH